MAKKKTTVEKPTKLVKILSKFNCQAYPLDDTAIEVTLEDLEKIGVTKCFDVENNSVIDYDNSADVAEKQKHERIAELKQLLASSDYKAIKYAEGLISAEDYEPIKQERQAYRDEINQLEA